MHVSMTQFSTRRVSDWEDNHRLRRGVCVASRIVTTKIPSAPLVAIMWLQRTWRPRFRHGTFSYGITTLPNIKGSVGDIENIPSVCMLVHPRFPMHMLCKSMLKKRHNYLFIYFSKGCEQDHGEISSWLHVRSNHDKDINTKNTLVLQHVWGQGIERKIQVDGNDMMIGESPLRLNSKIKTFPLT
jgi:hypothetical protein